MKICDCTIFFDEKMMYEIRLNSLNDYVDKFIVAESLFTHSGKKKKQNFNINDYPKFKDKIHYILLDSEPSGLYNGSGNASCTVALVIRYFLFNALSLTAQRTSASSLCRPSII